MKGDKCLGNDKIQNALQILIVFLALIPLLVHVYIQSRPLSENFDYQKESQLRQELSEKGTWVISDQQGARGPVEFTDATGEYLFLGYSHISTCVDVYDRNGEFQYSILFDDIQKGRFRMRCEGSRLYILTRKGQLFVFNGSTEVLHQTADEAAHYGYTKDWFQERNYRITIDDGVIEGVSSTSEDSFELLLPEGVRVNIKQTPISQLMILLLLVVWYLTRTFRNKAPACLHHRN